MESLGKLSDDQLINLFRNNKIDHQLKALIISEIDRRDLKKELPEERNPDFKTKIKIIFTSYFCYTQHLEKSSQLLANGDKKGYKLYWRYFIYGIVFYTIILLLVAKYYLNPNH
jgi:hypothetical protein